MNLEIHDSEQYIISFIMGEKYLEKYISYKEFGRFEDLPEQTKIVIVKSNFFDESIYGSFASLPETPFSLLPETDIPFLFGSSRLEKNRNGKFILYADLVASAYFLLSRYEEIIKPEFRDQFGRFLSKDSIVYQQGYGMRPLVDEWGRYLRNLLRAAGVDIPEEKHGFKKIFLTHDIDRPFYIATFKNAVKHVIKRCLNKTCDVTNPLKSYLNNTGDPFYTFPWLIEHDSLLKRIYGDNIVEDIYFIISSKSSVQYYYYPIKHRKYKKMLHFLSDHGSKFGLHISHEGGINPYEIKDEVQLLPDCVDKENLLSRNHYLRWQEPENVEQMEIAGIKEDFTLCYADSIGFRVGTCRPYRFINPKTGGISNIIIHPLEIMECSLFAKQYMNLEYKEALDISTKIINTIFDYNGECILLFHNSSFFEDKRYEKLYVHLLNTLKSKKEVS